MLYVTTRDDRDAFTAHRALYENRGTDGGLYLPFRSPRFTQLEVDGLLNQSFSQCVAEILNLLFNTKLSSLDIDFAIGRHPFELKDLGHRITIAETWHNLDWHYGRAVTDLTKLLRGQNVGQPGNWVKIAIRIAVLFGIFGELRRSGFDRDLDISVLSGDFSAPISAWYAKQWGLPIGNIVCCCNENNGLWDLFCHGQMRTDAVSVRTMIPEADIAVPDDLERLIFACGGVTEVQRYLEVCRQGRMYCLSEEMLQKMRMGLYVSVVSSQRVMTIIPSFYRTHRYLLSPYSALSYAGLADYRAKTGATRHCLLLSEKSPTWDADTVAKAMGIAPGDVKNYI